MSSRLPISVGAASAKIATARAVPRASCSEAAARASGAEGQRQRGRGGAQRDGGGGRDGDAVLDAERALGAEHRVDRRGEREPERGPGLGTDQVPEVAVELEVAQRGAGLEVEGGAPGR